MHVVGETLDAELGSRVYENVVTIPCEQGTGACAVVVWVVATTDGAVAGDHRDALTGAGSEKGDLDCHQCAPGRMGTIIWSCGRKWKREIVLAFG